MDIKNLHQVGEKTSKILNKLGIFTDDDLINYYPYRYNVYNFSNELIDNSTLIINVIIESNPIVSYIKKNFNRLSFRARYNERIFNVVIFNRAYLKTNLTIGKNITIIGKYDFKKNIFTSSDIKFNVTNGQIEPVYHLTKGITNNTVSKLIKDNFNNIYIKDSLPSNIISKYNLLSKKDALYNIHFSNDLKMVHYAKNRLIYEELFDFSFKMNYFKNQNIRKDKEPKNIDINKINEFKKLLPFSLTTDQDNAYNEIVQDMSSNKKMNRLLLGDVGSGKTVVAVGAIYANFIAGFESTLMAPTEVLATQHYFSIKKILDKFNVAVELITGSMSKKEKEAIYKRVQNKEIDLLIGTHSLLNENIIFNNLGLVITDEQHRFGVHQRFTLEDKSKCPDILYLSATPIPRTYAMTIYGDLDISYIKTKPTGRKDIITKVKKNSDIKEVLGLMLEQIKLGHQIYVVSPLVEEDESLNLTSINLLKEKLSLAFKNLFRIEIIHGKMKTSEKESIMNDFKNNQIKILIATTVIEVGIDVSNATMMVIFNAERFGLATLHQLRGRVGRSDLQSYCYLISDSDNDRLKVMEESNDGFYISQKDFEMRGHGDLFGVKQHGDMSFKLANLKNDYNILLFANEDAKKFIDSKEYLNNEYYKDLAQNLNITD
ncbi:aTP-dependent DNA helicase RecG [Mycoplasma sp. CAG:472]|nr:aTP-dependent DNA helicase RecG [Mycoplasma sp. CAG:472]